MSVQPFAYTAMPMRVRFGVGAADSVADEVDELGLSRLLVVSTPEQEPTARWLAGLLGPRCAAVHPKARMHVPTTAAAAAVEVAKQIGADGLLAVGGGSAVGLAKAVSLNTGLPSIAIPTTYAGSEMTSVWGLTEGGTKRTGRDPVVLPRSVIYDPALTTGLPTALTVTSGVNAIAHAAEALYAPDRSPIVSLMAMDGIRAMIAALPVVVSEPSGLDGRSQALYGAWLCGACLGATTMGLHHKLCHALGGSLDLPHADTHTVVLPYVLAFNAPAGGAELQSAMGTATPAQSLRTLVADLGGPTSLASLGMRESDIEKVAAAVVSETFANPRPVARADLVALLRDAWSGNDLG